MGLKSSFQVLSFLNNLVHSGWRKVLIYFKKSYWPQTFEWLTVAKMQQRFSGSISVKTLLKFQSKHCNSTDSSWLIPCRHCGGTLGQRWYFDIWTIVVYDKHGHIPWYLHCTSPHEHGITTTLCPKKYIVVFFNNNPANTESETIEFRRKWHRFLPKCTLASIFSFLIKLGVFIIQVLSALLNVFYPAQIHFTHKIRIYTHVVRIVGTRGKYDQRRLWK